jgi:hypothetical protein
MIRHHIGFTLDILHRIVILLQSQGPTLKLAVVEAS